MKSSNPHSGIYKADTSRTLDLNGGNPACNQGGIAIVQPICMATQQGGAEIRTDDKAPTLTAAAGMSGNNQPVIAFSQNQRDEIRDLGEKAGALQAQPGMKQQTFIIDSIGGQAESAKETNIAPTLKATHYKFPPSIALSAGFCTEHSAKARGVGFEEETSPTLRAGVTPACVYEWHNQDTRIQGPVDIACTLNTNAGGREGHLVMESVQLASGNEVTGCLMASGYEKLGAQEMFSGDYTVIEAQKPTDTYATDVGFFNSVKNVSPTLLSRGYKDPHLVTYPEEKIRYIVRRLTPTECARLQGFSDTWGHLDSKEAFSPEELVFWQEVRDTHATINGKNVKEYTEKQMLSWYNKLHTDSAEYKMWGNGIALPTALYCMEGIAEVLNERKGSISLYPAESL